METKMNVLGVEFRIGTVKNLLSGTLEYLYDETVNTVEIITMEMLIQGQDDSEWKNRMQEIDMLIPGDRDIFDAVGIKDSGLIREAQSHSYLRLILKYLEKHKSKVFLLAENETELDSLKTKLRQYGRLVPVGQAVLSAEGGGEEKVVNEINAVIPDCVLSILPCPEQEIFIGTYRALLNTKLWLGCRPGFEQRERTRGALGKLRYFMTRKFFCYLVGKEKEE